MLKRLLATFGVLTSGTALAQESPEEMPAIQTLELGMPTVSGPDPGRPVDTASVAESRDDDIFGSVSDALGRDDAVFGGGETLEDQLHALDRRTETSTDSEPFSGDSESRIFGTLEETNDRLQIGGRLYSRLDYSAIAHIDAEKQAISAPSLFDLYLDARPNERLRGYLRGRLKYDFTASDEGTTNVFGPTKVPLSVSLDQLFLKFDVEQSVFVTVGKQAVRWGTGRFWNPTDFLNQQRLDPLAVLDERLGVNLLKVHVPFESLGWNLYGIASWDGADSAEKIGGAFRIETLFDQTELSLSAAARKGTPLILGADISSGVWLFDLKAEFAVLHGVKTPFWKGAFIVGQSEIVTPTEVDREDDWIPQLVLGAEISLKYSDEDNLSIGAEYFYNDAGYANEDLYSWLGVRQAIASEPIPFLYLGKHYAAVYFLLMSPGSWNDTTIIGSALANLSDQSGLARLDWRVQLLTYLQLSVYGSLYLGKRGGEFRFGIEIPASPVLPEPFNQTGFTISEPLFQAGAGLTMSF